MLAVGLLLGDDVWAALSEKRAGHVCVYSVCPRVSVVPYPLSLVILFCDPVLARTVVFW